MEWPIVVPDAWKSEWLAASPEMREAAHASAAGILYALTGRVYGLRPVVQRPCFQPGHGTTYGGNRWWPGVALGNPGASGGCGCSSDCRHVTKDMAWLPGPVHEVTEVLIDGEVVNPDSYRVDGRRWLRRTDGKVWPRNQDVRATDDGAGAFTVRYLRGIPVPLDGQLAAGRLAVEVMRQMNGQECELPAHVTSVVRQGVSVEMDPRGYYEAGMTGLDAVDRWILAVNPHRSKAPARIVSPDAPRGVR